MRSAKKLGERKIIELILECLDQMPNMQLPFGDDASAVDLGTNKLAVINMDMLVRKTDVPKTMTLWQAARKTVIMNISDLAAKGVQPQVILASIGVPPNITKTDIQQIGNGLNAGAREYNTYIVGGDTNEASDLVISCMALGVCHKNHLIKRSGAEPGDYLATTGSFGKTAAGLKILMNGLLAPKNSEELVESVLMPKARVKEGAALAQSKAATASIDSSDGLAWSLHELTQASNVGFCLNKVSIAPEAERFAEFHGFDPLELALYGGEEYELLVTVKPKLWQTAQKAVETVGGNLTKLGWVTEKKQILLETDEKTVVIEARGWQHFKSAS
ncbi:MAG: thiamine-phosphate kinase [Candidatus Bathyarchaeota archaeon]|nr:thiamine-phosphate kinase [Candidatus Bathyarchaeum sp.]